ncbi:MAG: hypothetical protein U0Q22_06735 [Acidimicrobiales bacterium]
METTIDETTTEESEVDPARRSPIRHVVRVASAVVILYLGASLVAPGSVPRPTFLPKPAAGAPRQDRACGGPGNTKTPDWVARDGFWRPVVWSTLVGCA